MNQECNRKEAHICSNPRCHTRLCRTCVDSLAPQDGQASYPQVIDPPIEDLSNNVNPENGQLVNDPSDVMPSRDDDVGVDDSDPGQAGGVDTELYSHLTFVPPADDDECFQGQGGEWIVQDVESHCHSELI